MIFRFTLSLVLCFATTLLWGQCADAVAVAKRIITIKEGPTEQWLPACSQLKAQLDRCRAVQDSNYAEVLFLLGYAQSYAGDNVQAIKLTRTSIGINSRKSPNAAPIRRIQALYYLGNYLRADNQSIEAFEAYQQCITLGKQSLAQIANVTRALIGQAQVLYLRGDYEQALIKAQESYQTALIQQDKLLLAECSIEIARNQINLGKLAQAEKMARAGIELAKNDPYGSDIENVSRGILAIIFRSQNKTEEALHELERSANAYKAIGYLDQAAHAYNSIGDLYYRRNELDKAQVYFELAYANYPEKHNKAISLDNIGSIHRSRKAYEKALHYFQDAFQLLPISFRNKDVTKNPSAESIRLITHEEILLSIMQDKADTWLAYAKATNSRQYLRNALDTYRIADEMVDIMRWQQVGQQSKLFWRQKTRSMYERAIETCYQLKDTEQAFRFLEKSRAVMLTDKLNELGARQKLSPQQIAEEQRLLRSVGLYQAKLAQAASDSATYAKARTTLLAEQDKLDTFRKHLEVTNSAYFRYKYDNATPPLADLRRKLGALNTYFLSYFVGDKALYVLGVTDTSSTLIRQPVDPYNQNIKAFMDLLSNADAMNRKANLNQFLSLGHSLYQQLMASLRVPAGRVSVSPDGVFIPFETLSRSASQPAYLVNNYAFSYTYSAGLLLKSNADNIGKSGFDVTDFLGVAPVRFAPTLGQVSLPGSDVALQSIASRFTSPTLLTYQTATRRAFLQKAADARVVHLFTHAIADSSEREPLLYFADSTLRLSDLGDGSLPNAQLIVLAACKTGVGANQQGEGVFSLARGFAGLGAPSILTTLWSVENDATYKLTNLFYQYVDEGMPKDLALQRAKQDWLKSAGGVEQLPNFWAGLILVGDTEPLRAGSRWPWVAGGLLLITGGIGAWQWRRKWRAKSLVSFHRSA
ncbi:hypothetical protein GCM10027341_38910 [Spirosoma knui]